MRNSKPRIKVPYESMDIILELINLAMIIFIIAYTAISFVELPDTIPTHFNAKCEADGFGSKWTIWILAGISVFIYVLLYFVNKAPHLHNYMVNITEENALRNYRFSTRVIRFTNLFCLVLFALILYELVNMAKGAPAKIIGIPFLIITLVLPLIGVGIVFYYQKKINA